MNGIEKDLRGKAEVLRLNILTRPGKEVARRYEVKGIPTTVVVDGAGKVIYRQAGLPDRGAIVGLVKGAE